MATLEELVTAASASAQDASDFADDANTSAINAAGSASAATNSATIASDHEDAAALSATAASDSATAASDSATAASISASNAKTSEDNAGDSEDAAEGHATDAAASATKANGHELQTKVYADSVEAARLEIVCSTSEAALYAGRSEAASATSVAARDAALGYSLTATAAKKAAEIAQENAEESALDAADSADQAAVVLSNVVRKDQSDIVSASIGFARRTTSSSAKEITFDFAGGNINETTLLEDIETIHLSGAVGGSTVKIYVKQAAGSYGISGWPANVLWVGGAAPTENPQSNTTDVYTLEFDGVNYYAAVVQGYA